MINEYEKKLVLFLDIIGFTKLIRSKTCDEVVKVLNRFQNEFVKQNGYDIALKENGEFGYDFSIENGDFKMEKILGEDVKFIYFSDCVVITLDIAQMSIYRVFQYCANLQFELLLNGVMIRGGMSYGDIFHKENMIFGSAFLDAYEIEHSKIKHPFIGVDEDFFNKIPEAKKFQSTYFEYLEDQHVYRFNFLSVFHQVRFFNNPSLLELQEVLKFLNLNNDNLRTPHLIKYVEDFITNHSSPKKENL